MSRPSEKDKIILRGTVGSHSYGTATPTSDVGDANGPRAVSKTEAKKAAQQIFDSVNTPGVSNTSNLLFRDLVATWKNLTYPKLREQSRLDYESILNRSILPTFGAKTLCQITRVDVAAWQVGMKCAASTAKNTLVLFSQIWRWARRMNLWEGPDPAEFAEAGGKRNEKPGIVTVDQWNAICARLDAQGFADTALIARLCLATGCRVGEIIGMRWRCLSSSERTVLIDGAVDIRGKFGPTKTGDSRVAQIGRFALILDLWPRDGGEFVFANRLYITHSKRFKAAAKAAGVSCVRLGFHTARRLWATSLHEDGTPNKAIQIAGGWRTPEMVERYSRATKVAGMLEGIERLQGRIQ